MTQSDPRGMHDWHSGAYVQEWIGSYSDDTRTASLRRIAHLIPFDPELPIRVLDIGGGWGPVTQVVLEAHPRAQVVLHDFSDPMLEEASRRLERFGDAVTYYRGDLMAPGWTAGLEGQFDAVVSSLAIHNVRFPDRIRAIYQEIFPLVAPGGCLINLDQVAFGDLAGRSSRHAQRMDRRRLHYEETGDWQPLDQGPASSGPGRRLDAHAEPTPEDLHRMKFHEPATLPNQLRWLREAGFDEADCFARERGSALLGAFRGGARA